MLNLLICTNSFVKYKTNGPIEYCVLCSYCIYLRRAIKTLARVFIWWNLDYFWDSALSIHPRSFAFYSYIKYCTLYSTVHMHIVPYTVCMYSLSYMTTIQI